MASTGTKRAAPSSTPNKPMASRRTAYTGIRRAITSCGTMTWADASERRPLLHHSTADERLIFDMIAIRFEGINCHGRLAAVGCDRAGGAVGRCRVQCAGIGSLRGGARLAGGAGHGAAGECAWVAAPA